MGREGKGKEDCGFVGQLLTHSPSPFLPPLLPPGPPFLSLFSVLSTIIAVVSHFAPIKFPDIIPLLVICVTVYYFFCGILLILSYGFEKDAIFIGDNRVIFHCVSIVFSLCFPIVFPLFSHCFSYRSEPSFVFHFHYF